MKLLLFGITGLLFLNYPAFAISQDNKTKSTNPSAGPSADKVTTGPTPGTRTTVTPASTTGNQVVLGAPRNVTVVHSDNEIVVQWAEPSHTSAHEFYEKPDEVTTPGILPQIVARFDHPFSRRFSEYMKKHLRPAYTLTDIIVGKLAKHWRSLNIKNTFTVPKDEAVILSYVVVLTEVASSTTTEQETEADTFKMRINDLQRETLYKVQVDAVYLQNRTTSSDPVTFRTSSTHGYHNQTNQCHCDEFGRQPSNPNCYPERTTPCECLAHYWGVFCSLCQIGYYRVSTSFPCHPCPCNPQHSSGECQADHEGVWCTSCNPGYKGRQCQLCDYNYHPENGYCRRCECNNHQDPTASYVCSMDGKCHTCIHNTTGAHCELCADGYFPHPDTGFCLLHEDLPSHEAGLSKGVIAAIAIITIIVVSVIAGFIVYRCYQTPVRRQFWTVEVRGNPEGVNFSDLIDESDGKQLEDLSFRKTSRKDYALLQEDL